MSRVQKHKEERTKRKKLIYPLIALFMTAVLLIFVVDYRINNILGNGGIRIVGVTWEKDNITISAFDNNIASVNTEFVRRDIRRLRRWTFEYVNQFKDAAREVIKLY